MKSAIGTAQLSHHIGGKRGVFYSAVCFVYLIAEIAEDVEILIYFYTPLHLYPLKMDISLISKCCRRSRNPYNQIIKYCIIQGNRIVLFRRLINELSVIRCHFFGIQ